MYDVLILGAGISGSMLAKDLSQYKLKIGILDKENDIANGATNANSAIVHTGYDPKEGTLKAKLNVEGARMYQQLCKDLGCKYKIVGAYVVACSEEEKETLKVLKKRAEERNIEHELLSGDEARHHEKNLSDDVLEALSFPTTAVIYPWEVAIACCEVAVKNGVELHLNSEVTNIERIDDYYRVYVGDIYYDAKLIINASGVYADKICKMVSDKCNFEIKPRKGEYYVLDNDVDLVHNIIFPTPGAKGKGVLAVPTVYGNTLLGPTSDEDDNRDDVSTSSEGLKYVRDNIGRILKNVPLYKSIRVFAGLRPSSSNKDFIIEEVEDCPNFINVASIESPGLASAPAISKYTIDTLIKNRLSLVMNEKAVMKRQRPVVMSELREEERNKLIKENPLYGKMVCRCEKISEGEIVDAIHNVVGATSVKGIKKRVRPGMGKCQGGFCEPKVLAILARELNKSPLDIPLDKKNGKILVKENR